MTPLLAVRELHAAFATASGVARAVDGVSFDITAGEMVALVGESGCGKSALAASLMRLLPENGRIEQGAIVFEGAELLSVNTAAMRDIRGRRMSLIFQEPSSALDPLRRVGDQIAEVARAHGERSSRTAWSQAVRMLERTGFADPEESARRYPHQLSGGMRQRVLIAIALLLEPALVIADEPTTALDATIQRQILDLLRSLQREMGTALLLITHDLAIVEGLCERTMVMYGGQIVEDAPTSAVMESPAHPYAAGLVQSVPRLGAADRRLKSIPGAVPSASAWPTGCRFHDRCEFAWDRCTREAPELRPCSPSAHVRCHLIDEPARRNAVAAS